MMLFPKLSVLLAIFALAVARDAGKLMKTVPTISNSLVNLGKMEISFHFNGKHQDMPQAIAETSVHPDYYSQPAAVESCPCNSVKPPSFLSDPSEIINKILHSNDLFKDPTSKMCCESAEHMQENTVVFELNPNSHATVNAARNSNPSPMLPSFFRSPILPSFFPISNPNSGKSKTVEIFMIPKKNDAGPFDYTNFLKPKKSKDTNILKSDLQVIKDGGLQQSASVKKDLALTEKKVTEAEQYPTEELQTDAPPVTSGNTNTL